VVHLSRLKTIESIQRIFSARCCLHKLNCKKGRQRTREIERFHVKLHHNHPRRKSENTLFAASVKLLPLPFSPSSPALVCAFYRYDCSTGRYKASIWAKSHVNLAYTQRLDSVIAIDRLHALNEEKRKKENPPLLTPYRV